MNKIADVAKLLGVEIGEEFEIEGLHGSYKFTEYGLKLDNYKDIQVYAFTALVLGKVEIIKKPFRSRYNETYYYLTYSTLFEEWHTCNTVNMNTSTDLSSFKIGNCFKTKERAEQNKQKIIDLLSPYIAEVE